jgi:hypothetical protein
MEVAKDCVQLQFFILVVLNPWVLLPVLHSHKMNEIMYNVLNDFV